MTDPLCVKSHTRFPTSASLFTTLPPSAWRTSPYTLYRRCPVLPWGRAWSRRYSVIFPSCNYPRRRWLYFSPFRFYSWKGRCCGLRFWGVRWVRREKAISSGECSIDVQSGLRSAYCWARFDGWQSWARYSDFYSRCSIRNGGAIHLSCGTDSMYPNLRRSYS